MSLTIAADGRAVHFPHGDTFVFDSEVAEIFPDMALRSIPLFYETHALHAGVCRPWMEQEEVVIFDVGASRGAFLTELHTRYDLNRPEVFVSACDLSFDMAAKLHSQYPFVAVEVMDVTGDKFAALPNEKCDIINCTYVMQFLPVDKQVAFLRKLSRMLKPGGVMFLGQKMLCEGPAGRLLQEQYIDFRLRNGYTREEIEAKTAALANSMWPMPDTVLVEYLNKFGLETVETTRWGVFNNYMCTKGL